MKETELTSTTTQHHFGTRGPRALAAALATATVLTLAGATTAVAASHEGGPARILPATAPSHQAAAVTCTVNDNGVNYRSGPGENYQVFGTVNRGQKINVRGQQGNWYMGDLWGGRTGVWIHVAYVDC